MTMAAGPGVTRRIPPIQCLLTFEALARLRSVTLTAEALCVTPSAVSHRVRQLEQALGLPLFERADFSLTSEGSAYLAQVRTGLASLERLPGLDTDTSRRRLRVAVTPTFSRSILMPRLHGFIDAYPEIDLTLQVSLPLLDQVSEEADMMVRFGRGGYSDVEHVCLLTDDVTPLAAPRYVRTHGPFDSLAALQAAKLIQSPLEPWRTWFLAHGLDAVEPAEGSSFNDIGLLCDAAAQGLGIALVRLKLGQPWLDNGTLVRLSPRNVPSPHAHYLCWRSGALERWECAAFADWLRASVQGLAA